MDFYFVLILIGLPLHHSMYLYHSQATQRHLYKKAEPNYAQNISISLNWFWANDARAMEIRCCSRLFRFRLCTLDVPVFFFWFFSVKELVIYSHNYLYNLKVIDIYSHSFLHGEAKAHRDFSMSSLSKFCVSAKDNQRLVPQPVVKAGLSLPVALCFRELRASHSHRMCCWLLTSCLDPHPWDSLHLMGRFQMPVLS